MAGPKCGTCNLPKIGMIRIPDDESDYMCGDCIRIAVESGNDLAQEHLATLRELRDEQKKTRAVEHEFMLFRCATTKMLTTRETSQANESLKELIQLSVKY